MAETKSIEEKIPWLTLRLLPEMTRVRFYALIDHFQMPALVFGAQAKEIAALRGFDAGLARKVLEAPRNADVHKELALMDKHDVRLLTLDDDEYPENLRQSSFPPPVLFVRGAFAPHDRYAVAMVGSRTATQYGRAVAQQLAARLATCGITIISGFARGIDSVAHAAALSVRGRTIGVLGNGHAVCYPAENRKLGDQILERGALVTEYPMETPPDRFNFPERNHVIAALSLGAVVVEAAEKSGALITANEALEENRFVFAVPGDINRQNSRGANALIQQGAKLVQRGEDILHEMKDLLKGYLKEEQIAAGAETQDSTSTPGGLPRAQLTDEERTVYGLIRHEPRHFDAIAAVLPPEQITVQRLSAILLSLELKQFVRQMPGKVYAALEM